MLSWKIMSPWPQGCVTGHSGNRMASSYIRPQARCLGLPFSPELRSATTAAAMKSLLLALGLALVCGAQAVHIPRKVEGLDIRAVRGWGQGLRGRRKAWAAEV